MKKRTKRISLLICLIIAVAAYFWLSRSFFGGDPRHMMSEARLLIEQLGVLAPIGVVVLQILQTMVSIIPSQFTTILSGFLFGPIGLLYNVLGGAIGSAFVFLLSRKYGKDVVSRFFEKKDILHFHLFFQKRGGWALFLARVTPIFPNDLVSIAAGLTKITFWEFNVISTFGFAVQMTILTLFGSELSSNKVSITLMALSALLGATFLTLLFKEQIKRWLVKDIQFIERKGKMVERKLELEFKKI